MFGFMIKYTKKKSNINKIPQKIYIFKLFNLYIIKINK